MTVSGLGGPRPAPGNAKDPNEPDTYAIRIAPEEQARKDMERVETRCSPTCARPWAMPGRMVDSMRRAETLTPRFAEA
jgi:hypothetical protein